MEVGNLDEHQFTWRTQVEDRRKKGLDVGCSHTATGKENNLVRVPNNRTAECVEQRFKSKKTEVVGLWQVF